MKPAFSIITVCMNPGDSIRHTFRSVIEQKNVYLEYIVIDGGSADGTIEWLNEPAQRVYVDKLISEKDDGIYDAINKGISLSSGSLIGLLHAGDIYCPDVLKLVQDIFLGEGRQVDVICGDMLLVDGDSSVLKSISKNALTDLDRNMTLFHPATFITKNAYANLGLYNIKFNISADFDLLRRFYLKGARFKIINKVFVSMQFGGISAQFKSIRKISQQTSDIVYGENSNFVKYCFFYILHLRIMVSMTRHHLNKFIRICFKFN